MKDKAVAASLVADEVASLDILDSPQETAALASEMQQRCSALLGELEQFQKRLKHLRRNTQVEMRTFKGGLQAELKLLTKLSKADPANPKTKHALRSSNLSFYDAVWSTAKTCSSVTALGKRFYWIPGQNASFINGRIPMTGTAHRTHSALVDIVSEDGLEWIKVSSVTEKRIIWDLAKAGWVDSDNDSEDDLDLNQDDDPQGLFKQVEALIKASRSTCVRYRHPKVRLVLPRIKAEPESEVVANILRKIRALGVLVEPMDAIPSAIIPVDNVVDRLAADRFYSFSDILNVDCTILLAFASDLSHGRVEPEDWHNKDISRQIRIEAEDRLLPNSLWPACGSRKLVCTRAAAVRMQEIIEIIGTENERKRAKLMLQPDGNGRLSQQETLSRFQELSDYSIPSEWALPIEVVDEDISYMQSTLPPIAAKVAEKLTSINQSVFFYGWKTGLTTISSNGSVAKDIESTIEENREDEDTAGPDIWLSSSSRSLVGKEKQRRGLNGKS